MIFAADGAIDTGGLARCRDRGAATLIREAYAPFNYKLVYFGRAFGATMRRTPRPYWRIAESRFRFAVSISISIFDDWRFAARADIAASGCDGFDAGYGATLISAGAPRRATRYRRARQVLIWALEEILEAPEPACQYHCCR